MFSSTNYSFPKHPLASDLHAAIRSLLSQESLIGEIAILASIDHLTFGFNNQIPLMSYDVLMLHMYSLNTDNYSATASYYSWILHMQRWDVIYSIENITTNFIFENNKLPMID